MPAGRARWIVVSLILLGGVVVPGSASQAEEGKEQNAYPKGLHPWPAGDEWPKDLTGPFGLEEVRREGVRMDDGVVLDGWIYLPDLPSGVRAPVVLVSSQYFGTLRASAADPEEDDPAGLAGVPVSVLVQNGYAVALFSVRGTGHSGGCHNWLGDREQQDHHDLVQWLSARPWSNGRVGMMGLSYDGATPIEAAVMNPPALKTIVVAGTISDWYLMEHSPNGAFLPSPPYQAAFVAATSFAPPVNTPLHFSPEGWLQHAPHRLCPEVLEVVEAGFRNFAYDRDQEFYAERRFTERLARTRAAAFITHGFGDCGHCWQEDTIWEALKKAPKRMLEGPWGHGWPNSGTLSTEEWHAQVFGWLDFWLKGLGSPPGVGTVDYQDNAQTWRRSTSWPPKEAVEEVLYLGDAGLSESASGGTRTFRAVQALPPDGSSGRGADITGGTAALCPGAEAISAAYVGRPLSRDATIAGNPFAYLAVSSDQPGGVVEINLVALPPGTGCWSGASDHHVLAHGLVDLRHHRGNLDDAAFPVGTRQHVRVDLLSLAETVPAGYRLMVVAHAGEAYFGHEMRFQPKITVDGNGVAASQVVLPIVQGTAGGSRPKIKYPPRPFAP